MAVHADMPTRRDNRAAEAQFAARDAVEFLREIDGREDLLRNRFVIGRWALLPENKARGQERQTGATQCTDMASLHLVLP